MTTVISGDGVITTGNTDTNLVLQTGNTTALTVNSSQLVSFSNAIPVPTITGLKEVKVAIAASDIDLSAGNFFTKTISATTTFTVSNVPASGTAITFILELTNGGSQTVNWFSGNNWVGGTAPTLTSSGRDVLAFYTFDNGTTWNGFVVGLDVKAP
jgi:hypothetical protein